MPTKANQLNLKLACGELTGPLPNRSNGNCAPRAFLRSLNLPYTPKDITRFRRRLAAGCDASSARYSMLAGKKPLAFDVGELQYTASTYQVAIALHIPHWKWVVFMPKSDCGASFNDIPTERRSFLCIKGTGHCQPFLAVGRVDLSSWELYTGN